jgi:hypothetical protein
MLKTFYKNCLFLTIISLNFIYVSSGYAFLPRIYNRFDAKQHLINEVMTDEDRALAELRKLELKLKSMSFYEKDLVSLFRLVGLVKSMRNEVETPPVYWYSRQGRMFQ